MNDLISPFQSSFILARRATDNVVILWEAISSLKRKAERKGTMILKLDVEKAYDRLEWDFIKEVLNFFGFPSNFVKLVMNCVALPRISILLNGGKLEPFYPSRGVRHGDPMSPYLFIICLEYLSILIEKET